VKIKKKFGVILTIVCLVTGISVGQFYQPGPQDVTASAWNNNGTLVAVGYGDGTLEIWDNLGNLVQTLGGHTSSVEAIAWNATDSRLAAASSDLSVQMWDTTINPWQGIGVSFDGREYIRDLTWFGTRMFGVAADDADSRTFWEWDEQGSMIRSQSLPQGSGDQIAIQPPDGLKIAIGTLDAIYILDSQTLSIDETIDTSSLDGNETIIELVWSSNGTKLLSGHLSGYLRLFNMSLVPHSQEFEVLGTNTPATVRGIYWTDTVLDISFGLNENTVVAIGADGTLRQWDVNSQSLLRDTNIGSTDTLYGAGISASSKLLVTEGSTQSQIQLTDLNLDPVAAGTASHSIGRFSLPPGIDPHPGGDQEISIVLDASASVDPDGSIVEYNWGTFAGDDSLYSGTQTNTFATITVSGCGAPAVYLTVIDNDGATDTIAVTVSDYFGSC